MELPLTEEWSEYDWTEVLAPDEAPAREDIEEVLHQRLIPGPSGYAEMDLAAVMRLKDGRWATVHAGTDTTGWGCHGDYVRWYVGPTLEDAIYNGLTNESRRWLNLELPES